MTSLAAAAFAKINLGLDVLGRREDGYHEIRTVLQTIDLSDRLLFEPADDLSLRVEGAYPAPADESNLVLRAARAIAALSPGRGARITLRKQIPAGAGLGGGSSDAAVTLMALDRLWGMGSDPSALHAVASGLGADVPFFLYGGTCLALGRGEEIFPLPDPPEWHVLVAWPAAALATRDVYEALPLSLTRNRILSSMRGFVPPGGCAPERETGPPGGGAVARREGVRAVPRVHNDLEPAAFGMLPRLGRLKDRILRTGAAAAAMSGSGSAVFGLYGSARDLDAAAAAVGRGETVVFRCRTLTREAYRESLFDCSWT